VTDLPGILQEIADVAGEDAALIVAKMVGGRRAYFPPVPKPDHWLARAVGLDKARAICQHFTGGKHVELFVPLGPAGSRARRHRLIAELIDEGASETRIVAAAGVTRATVYRHRKARLGQKRNLRQGDLFSE
jgi:hypothetical protein